MTLQGSTKDFPLESVVGLLAGTSKTGELQIRGADQVGALGFSNGRLVAAVCGDHGGEDALGAIFSIRDATFEFMPWTEAPEGNLEGDLDALLRRAAESRDRLASIRAVIPDDAMRFRLSERAADQGAVTFTPERWRALLAVNGDRDVAGISQHLGIGPLDALNLLAGLVRDGVIEPVTTPGPPPRAAAEAAAPSGPAAAPSPPPAPDWMSAPAPAPARAPAPEWRPPVTEEPEWTLPPRAETAPAPAEPAPSPSPAQPTIPEWAAAAPAAPEWTAPAPTSEWAPAPPAQREEPPAPQAPPPDWAAAAAPPPPDEAELRSELGSRFDSYQAPEAPPPAPPAREPADDRLSALSGIFGPPTQEAPPPPPAESWTTPAPAPAADAWSSPPPALDTTPGPSAPAAWNPTAPPTEEASQANQWAPSAPEADVSPASEGLAGEWTPPAPAAATPLEKKKGGLFGMFSRERPTAVPAAAQEPLEGATRLGALAAFSNALLAEYNSGRYGKARVEERMANLLMRVDEQADPIDRPLPIVDDRIDVQALEREALSDQQAAPYLASLARQIYEDAEKAFGKDKARKGYKAAQQRIFLGDASVLHAPDVAGKLPRV